MDLRSICTQAMTAIAHAANAPRALFSRVATPCAFNLIQRLLDSIQEQEARGVCTCAMLGKANACVHVYDATMMLEWRAGQGKCVCACI